MNLFSRLKRIGAGNKSSVTLPVTVSVVSTQSEEPPVQSLEVYKVISEDKETANSKNSQEALSDNMVKEENFVGDGADEEMLGVAGDGGNAEDKLAERRDEVKFIKGDHQNGDAKIDIGNLNGGKPAFTGMSKEELMKYANDPFWVRLRWIFFVTFWMLWIGMLVGAILIIIGAPKCAAPEPLPWYKRGLHAKFGNVDTAKTEDVQAAQKIYAAGAIYELPALQTYEVKKPDVESQIKRLVDLYKSSDVKIILDLTPNYVNNNSQLLLDALSNAEGRAAFIWVNGANDLPNNWKKVGNDVSAWDKLQDSYVLSQFEAGTYDLKMNSTLVRREFGGVLQHLIGLGVHGFRLKNTKFYQVSNNLADEEIAHPPKDMNLVAKDYGFYTHEHSAFQEGLGDVLYDYLGIVKNASSDAFLSVAEDIIRPQAYVLSKSGGALGIDLPMYGEFIKTLSSSRPDKKLLEPLNQTLTGTGNGSWLQWNFADVYIDTSTHPSALALFMSLLPGVPVVPVDSIEYANVSEATYNHIQQLRLSPSYMHGELKISEANQLIAYSRFKSGNPGYFVIFNPTDLPQTSNFTAEPSLPAKMTVSYFSENYNSDSSNATKIAHSGKVSLSELQVAPHSTIVLTYVPMK